MRTVLRLRVASVPSPSFTISLRDRVARFVKPQIATAGQADGGQEAPPLIADGSASDALCGQASDLLSYVVAHEVELLLTAAVSGMAGDFRRWCGEDEPTIASVNRRKAEHVTEEGAVRVGIARIDHRMQTRDHENLPG